MYNSKYIAKRTGDTLRQKSTSAVARTGNGNVAHRGGSQAGGQVARRPSFSELSPAVLADPFRAMETMDRAMGSMFNDAFRMMGPFMPPGFNNMLTPFGGRGGREGLMAPFRTLEQDVARTLERTVGRANIALDIAEFSDRYEIHAELPGVDKDSLRCDVDEDVWPHTLTITAQKTIMVGEPAQAQAQAEGQQAPSDASTIDVKGGEAKSASEGEGATDQTQAHGRKAKGKGKEMTTTGGQGKDTAVQAWHRTERLSGTVSRTIALPEDADIGSIGARLANGVLTVSVPRRKLAETEEVPGRRTIQIQ